MSLSNSASARVLRTSSGSSTHADPVAGNESFEAIACAASHPTMRRQRNHNFDIEASKNNARNLLKEFSLSQIVVKLAVAFMGLRVHQISINHINCHNHISARRLMPPHQPCVCHGPSHKTLQKSNRGASPEVLLSSLRL